MRMLMLILAFLLPVAPLAAADAPLRGPVPDWVVRVDAPPTQSAATEGQAAALRLFDVQLRFDEAGDHSYTHTMVRIASPDALAAAGNLALAWHPGTQAITVHRVVIHRGSEQIDVLARDPGFTVLRREGGLEQSVVDGLLTATLQIRDLRVGDTIELAVTVDDSNPVLRGHSQSYAPIAGPFTTDRLHFLASWRSTRRMRWRAGEALPRPLESRRNGLTTLTLDQAAFAAATFPAGAPARFLDTFAIQIGDFEAWRDISALFAPIYAAAARIGETSPLRAEAVRIAAATQDPVRRAEQALALVQDQVRYVADGTGLGGYIPASADQVWASRYGDCKGKTALLIALLRELGIEAEAAAVSATRGDGVDIALPMPARFDHVIARVRIAGRTYWLDGTRTGDRSLERIAVPSFRWALPLTARGSELERLAPIPAAEPATELNLEYDLREGITMPAKIRAELVVRGDEVIALRRSLEFMSAADRQASVRSYWTENFSNLEIERADHSVDPQTGTLRYTMSGSLRLSWDLSGANPTRRLELTRARLGRDFAPQRRPGPWADLPLALAAGHYSTRYVILLPEGGQDFIVEGEPIDRRIGPTHYRRTARISSGRVDAEAVTRIDAGEISYAQAQSDDAASDDVYAKRLFVRAPLTYRLTAAERAAAARAGGAAASAIMSAHDLARSILNTAQSGNLAAALVEVNAAIERQGRSAMLLLLRSQLQSDLGNAELADSDLDAALALEPNNPMALMSRASRLAAGGRNEDAMMILDRLILTRPTEPSAYVMRAGLRAAANRLDAALGDLDIAIQQQPENRHAWIQRVTIHNSRGDRQRALEAAEGLLRLFPQDDTAHALHGNVLAIMGRREEAKAALARSLAIRESADAYSTRAAYDLSGDAQARLADLLAVIRLAPDRPLPGNALRAVLEIDGAQQRLEAAYQARRSEDPQPPAQLVDRALAVLRAAAGRDADLLVLMDAEIAAQPRSATLLNNRCWHRAIRGVGLDQALADCNAAVAISPLPGHLDSRGLVQLRRGDFAAAIRDYDAALAQQPRLAHSLYGRGLAKRRQGTARAATPTSRRRARRGRRSPMNSDASASSPERMPSLHMSKVAVSCASIETLRRRLEARVQGGVVPILTRFRPRRADELIGGSIYWIVKHRIAARQTILGFDIRKSDRKTIIRLDPELVPVQATPMRAHQGWRYLNAEDVPPDLGEGWDDPGALPPDLAGKLAVLALI